MCVPIEIHLAEQAAHRQQLETVADTPHTKDTNNQPTLVLASGSPRRRTLLKREGIEFSIVESRIHERRRPEEDAETFALRMAAEKAIAVSNRITEPIVLGADTVVDCGGEILGKPKDAEDARRMLRMLSGRSHTVTTAFAIARAGELIETHAVQSGVTFRLLGDEEIDAYIASGDPFDKAGSYGIQDGGATFIAAVDGSRDNVMGLPVDDVLDALTRLGIAPDKRPTTGG
jgi:septum formation protein